MKSRNVDQSRDIVPLALGTGFCGVVRHTILGEVLHDDVLQSGTVDKNSHIHRCNIVTLSNAWWGQKRNDILTPTIEENEFAIFHGVEQAGILRYPAPLNAGRHNFHVHGGGGGISNLNCQTRPPPNDTHINPVVDWKTRKRKRRRRKTIWRHIGQTS